MKRLFLALSVLYCVLCSCGTQYRTVSLTNDSSLDRHNESVLISYAEIGLSGLSEENACVITRDGENVPCQTISDNDGNHSLLFQADVLAGSTADYRIFKGMPIACDTLVNSRYVPERKDDYEFENNIVIGRIYGPALASPRTLGPDVWIKNTPRLVFDEWLAGRDFHHNHGEGMDCYQVGAALGGGACAPLSDDGIVIGENWETQMRICNGPLRTAAEFTHAAFVVDEVPVTVRRSLSLDANTRLVHWATTFEAEKDSLDVVVGAVLHDVISREYGTDYISFTEWASDSKTPQTDGKISIGVILSDRFKAEPCEIDGHAVLKFRVKCGETVDYWTASGWDQGGVESPEAWNEYMLTQAVVVNHPLIVKVKR